MFRGIYGGTRKHEDDLELVLKRSVLLDKIIITVGTVKELDEAISVTKLDSRLFITLGVHPTRCNEFEENDPEVYFNDLCSSLENHKDKIVALGEMGLDYDRLHFCEKDVQKKYFEKQLKKLCPKFNLPLFLHSRNAHRDFYDILERNMDKVKSGGVIHSFTGTFEEAEELIKLGFFIGLNGCSLKSEENLEVVKKLPANKIMIETDAPWCGIRSSHAGFKFIKTKFPTVKKKEKWNKDFLIDGRNEPCQILLVIFILFTKIWF